MFKTIVIPVDGSSLGERALPLALDIARRSQGAIRLVSVVTPLPTQPPSTASREEEARRLDQDEVQAAGYQARLRENLVQGGWEIPISCHVERGSVVDELDSHARGAWADLLVLTTHGRGPFSRAWLGSVADGLLRRTPCPILVIPSTEEEGPEADGSTVERILVTLDGSPESREILPIASRLARIFEANLILFRVIPPHFSITSSLASHTRHDFGGQEAEEMAAEEALQAEAESLRAQGFSVDTQTLSGVHPAEGILEFSERSGADVVAMTTHGRGGVARLLLGSVADKVIRGGRIPVLLHRAPGGSGPDV
jgi:nucleotide-binding universal stress UspA family protein